MKYRLLSVLAMLLLLAGCSSDTGTPVNENAISASGNEIPADVQRAFDENAPSDEIILSDMSHAPVATDDLVDYTLPGYDVYSVTFLWGSVLSPTAVANTETIDWSGSLSLFGAGAIRTIAQIDFEANQDELLPDNLPEIEEWVSFTNGDYDGLSFLVYVDRHQVIATIPRITLATGPIWLEYQTPELKELAEFHPISNTAGVAVFARQITFRPCPEGTLEGNWINGSAFGDSGLFRGMWLNDLGVPMGSYSGVWRLDYGAVYNGGTMEGKVYAANSAGTTKTIAILRGKWGYDDPRLCMVCGAGHGAFEGSFWFSNDVSIDARPDGHFKGEFGDWSAPPALVMPMTGKWKVNCPHISANDPSTVP